MEHFSHVRKFHLLSVYLTASKEKSWEKEGKEEGRKNKDPNHY